MQLSLSAYIQRSVVTVLKYILPDSLLLTHNSSYVQTSDQIAFVRRLRGAKGPSYWIDHATVDADPNLTTCKLETEDGYLDA